MPTPDIRLILVEDHAVLAVELEQWINVTKGLQCGGVYGSGGGMHVDKIEIIIKASDPKGVATEVREALFDLFSGGLTPAPDDGEAQ